MPSTNCCPSCDVPRTIKRQVFGHELDVKNYICSSDGCTYREKSHPVQLQLSVCPTSYCAAACPFCIATNTASHDRIDLRKLETVLLRLKEDRVVRGVSITGGEPFTDVALLNDTLDTVFGVLGFDAEVSVNTNGIGLHRLSDITHLSYLDALHISRHHFDEAFNARLFGVSVPTNAQLKEMLHAVPYRDLFVLNCMLLKDGIATPELARRYLDFAIEMGAGKVSFITATPVNAYAARQRVDYREVLQADDPSMLFTRGFFDYDFCRCQDGVYVSEQGDLIEFYGRTTDASDVSYCRGLVYGADNHLRVGYNGECLV